MPVRSSRRLLVPVLAAASAAALLACGDSDTPPLVPPGITYVATLTELNGSGVVGTATFVVDAGRDTFSATVQATGMAPGEVHAQHVHAAPSCPSSADDANGDGFVDVLEGLPRYGAILVPLDGDLSTQAGGASGYPTATVTGSLAYSRTTSLSALLADLRAPDPDPTDPVVKLVGGEPLALDGRTVVLHGVATGTMLPGTVASLGAAPATATLPVACGDLRRVN